MKKIPTLRQSQKSQKSCEEGLADWFTGCWMLVVGELVHWLLVIGCLKSLTENTECAEKVG
jgi:hypothetical protein